MHYFECNWSCKALLSAPECPYNATSRCCTIQAAAGRNQALTFGLAAHCAKFMCCVLKSFGNSCPLLCSSRDLGDAVAFSADAVLEMQNYNARNGPAENITDENVVSLENDHAKLFKANQQKWKLANMTLNLLFWKWFVKRKKYKCLNREASCPESTFGL